MRFASSVLGALLFTVMSACSGGAPAEAPPETAAEPVAEAGAEALHTFTNLFDGTSLSGWTTLGDANWQVVDGLIQADEGNGFLVTDGSYGDFHLKLEFWVDPDANSGVFIRCSDPSEVGAANAYEVNIYDKRPDPQYRTGGIVNLASPSVALDTGNQWNTYEIVAQGPRLLITLNGTVTVDVEDMQYAQGPIALQHGAGIVKFRNIQIAAL